MSALSNLHRPHPLNPQMSHLHVPWAIQAFDMMSDVFIRFPFSKPCKVLSNLRPLNSYRRLWNIIVPHSQCIIVRGWGMRGRGRGRRQIFRKCGFERKPNNNGKWGKIRWELLIGNFIKIFDIKYINKFIRVSPTLSPTIYLTHISERAKRMRGHTHWSFQFSPVSSLPRPPKHIPTIRFKKWFMKWLFRVLGSLPREEVNAVVKRQRVKWQLRVMRSFR